MNEIVHLGVHDYAEAMDFLNMVFSMSSRPHDFARLIPKLYQPDEELMHHHLAIRRNGRIRAIVGVYPLRLHAGGLVLETRGIGAVSTHPEERSSGMMSALMNTALSEMRNQQVDFSSLGGQRQRYGHFGYEKCGVAPTLSLDRKNLRSLPFRTDSSALTFIELRMRDLPDALSTAETLDVLAKRYANWRGYAKALFDRQPIHYERSLDAFVPILLSFNCRAWLAFAPTGNPAGYLVSDSEYNIQELHAETAEDALHIATGWLLSRPDSVSSVRIRLAPWQQDELRLLGHYVEHFNISLDRNYRIFNWPRTVGALLTAQAALRPLAAGRLRFAVRCADPSACDPQSPVAVWEAEVSSPSAAGSQNVRWAAVDDGGGGQVRAGDGSGGGDGAGGGAGGGGGDGFGAADLDLDLDDRTMSRLLFGPLPPHMVLDLSSYSADVRRLLESWLPLPLYCPFPDHV